MWGKSMDGKRWEKKNYRKKFNKPQERKVEVKCGVEFIYCANYVKKILFIGLLPCTTIPCMIATQCRIFMKSVHYYSTFCPLFHLMFYFLLWNLFLLYLYWYLSFLICTFSLIFQHVNLFSVFFTAVQPEEKKIE